MGQHRPIRITSWVIPSGKLQYTLSVCDECKIFKLEAMYPDGENHGDLRYLNHSLRETTPDTVTCPALKEDL